MKKTKTEDHPNFRDLREERDAEERRKKKQQLKEEEAKRKVDEENRKKEAELKYVTSIIYKTCRTFKKKKYINAR